MRVVLEGRRLARTRDLGGADIYWRNLITSLLEEAPDDLDLVLLSAFLNPVRTRALEPFRRSGAVLRHHWAAPQWIDRAGRLGARTAWFAGRHDLVHAVEPVWTLRGRAPLVVTVLDLMYHHHPHYLHPSWVRRLEEGTRDLARRATFWICISANTRDELVKHFGVPPGRTAVVYIGVDERFRRIVEQPDEVQRLRQRLELEDPYFLFLGSVEPKKNLPLLLDAFGVAMDRGLRARLVVAGRAGWGSEQVRRAAEESPRLRERLRFLGFVDDADLPGLVAGARALVLPSHWEGFGIPVLEAMAAGTPVLCSDRGALPEIAGGAARHFDARDVDGLAELLLAVDGDDALCEDLNLAGKKRARAFTWRRCAQETLDVYRRALEIPR